jgi:hypothetical protein
MISPSNQRSGSIHWCLLEIHLNFTAGLLDVVNGECDEPDEPTEKTDQAISSQHVTKTQRLS